MENSCIFTESHANTYSEVRRFARKTFIAAPKSSLDKASSSGYSDTWPPTSVHIPPIIRRPTSGIGSTRDAHKSLDLHGSRFSGISGCIKAFVDLRVISLANENILSPLSIWRMKRSSKDMSGLKSQVLSFANCQHSTSSIIFYFYSRRQNLMAESLGYIVGILVWNPVLTSLKHCILLSLLIESYWTCTSKKL